MLQGDVKVRFALLTLLCFSLLQDWFVYPANMSDNQKANGYEWDCNTVYINETYAPGRCGIANVSGGSTEQRHKSLRCSGAPWPKKVSLFLLYSLYICKLDHFIDGGAI